MVPTDQNVITRLAQDPEPLPMAEDAKKIIMTIFSHLQEAHENIAQVAGAIVNLGEVTHPDTFGFVLKLAVCPLIQLKFPPPHLFSPGDLHFSKGRLTPEEMCEEMCVNELLLKPFHPEFSKVPHKHPTRVLATAVHFLICKRMFDTKISQAELSQDFAIAEKKLHMAVSESKYDPGKKASKSKGEPKDPKEQTEQKKPKMTQQVTTTETAWQATETESSQQATNIPDT